jgi:hypothetical protein
MDRILLSRLSLLGMVLLLGSCAARMQWNLASKQADSTGWMALDPAEFAERYDLDLPSDPALVGSQLLAAQRMDSEGRRAETLMITYNDTQAEVVLTVEGLADDSVQGIRYQLEMSSTSEGWILVSVRQQQHCWPGRGHTHWSDQQCV